MRRRINSTGRKGIGRGLVAIRLIEPPVPSQPRFFAADLSGLEALDLPLDARVYLEAYVTGSSSMMRFDFGTLGALADPGDTTLSDLDAGGRILFRVKVVDESGEVGKILASVNALRPLDEKISEDERKAILPVASDDLGEGVWRLEFQTPERPVLVVNNRVPGLMDRIKTEPLLQGAIVPAAIGLILRYVLDPENGAIDDDLDWVADWKRWATALLGRNADADIEEPEELERRVADICERFVSDARFVSKLERLMAG